MSVEIRSKRKEERESHRYLDFDCLKTEVRLGLRVSEAVATASAAARLVRIVISEEEGGGAWRGVMRRRKERVGGGHKSRKSCDVLGNNEGEPRWRTERDFRTPWSGMAPCPCLPTRFIRHHHHLFIIPSLPLPLPPSFLKSHHGKVQLSGARRRAGIPVLRHRRNLER